MLLIYNSGLQGYNICMTDLLTDSEFEKFRKIIYDKSGITFSATNRSILDSRLKEKLREKNLASVQDYYNAAKIDGTSRTRVFFKITLPIILPMVFFLIISISFCQSSSV